MNEHASYVVFKNLPSFFKSRGLTLRRASPDFGAPRDQFVTELNHIGYFRADAEDGEGRTVSVLLLALQGKYTDHGPQLRNLVSSLESEPAAKTGRLAEILVIAPEDVLGKKNMVDIVAEFRARAREARAAFAGATTYNMYAYHVFSFDVPAAQIVPPHEIVSPAEAEAFLARERLELGDLKKMSASDPPLVWIGGQPGQVVRTISPSETAGEAHDYWLVTR